MRIRLACGRSRVQSSGPATFFSGDWSWNHFYGRSLPTANSSRAVVSYWQKDVHLVLVNRLVSLPRNSVVRLTDCLNMTIVVDWDHKSNKTKSYLKENDNHCTLNGLSRFWLMRKLTFFTHMVFHHIYKAAGIFHSCLASGRICQHRMGSIYPGQYT